MKIIEHVDDELMVEVSFDTLDEKEQLLQLLKANNSKIIAHKNGREHLISIRDIYYIESVDKTTILYTKSDSYVSLLWLYQLEAILDEEFIRINKSTIINLRYLKSMKADIGSRIRLEFHNGDRFIVTRAYAKEFKRKLGGN